MRGRVFESAGRPNCHAAESRGLYLSVPESQPGKGGDPTVAANAPLRA
jgi:hypothetical protein